MITITHENASSLDSINKLLQMTVRPKCSPVFEKSTLLKLLFSDPAYKVILGRDNGSPFALCIYHYRSDFIKMLRGLTVDVLFVDEQYLSTGTVGGILKLLAQKAVREGLDFLEILCRQEDEDIYPLQAFSREGTVCYRLEEHLHEYAVSGCSYKTK
ncbi:MAG: hypothetical protein ACI3VB_06470 [Oscillospiraceae bacterium]